jgi:hypothetical protein
LLGDCSIYLLKKLESEGLLTPVRINPRSATAQVFYRRDELMRIARQGGE